MVALLSLGVAGVQEAGRVCEHLPSAFCRHQHYYNRVRASALLLGFLQCISVAYHIEAPSIVRTLCPPHSTEPRGQVLLS